MKTDMKVLRIFAVMMTCSTVSVASDSSDDDGYHLDGWGSDPEVYARTNLRDFFKETGSFIPRTMASDNLRVDSDPSEEKKNEEGGKIKYTVDQLIALGKCIEPDPALDAQINAKLSAAGLFRENELQPEEEQDQEDSEESSVIIFGD